MVVFPEHHLALRRVELQAFHRRDQLLGVGRLRLGDGGDDGHRGGEAARGEEVRRRVEALLVLGDQPVVHRVLRDLVEVVGGAFHAGQALIGGECRQDVAAGGELDAVALRIHVLELGQRIAGAGPDHPDHLAARLVLQRVEQALADRGEVGGRGRGIFFGGERRAGLGECLLEGGDAVAAEGIVLRQRCNGDALLADRDRIRDRVLRGVARGAEDVAIPLLAGNLVRDRRLDDQDLLVLLGDRENGKRCGRRCRADRDIGLVVLIGFRERGLGEIGLALVVLGDDDDLAAVERHGALGGVFKTHLQAGLGLLGVGLERTGLAVDQRDLEVVGPSGGARGEGEDGCCYDE